MKTSQLFPFVFLFIFLLSSPAWAYLTPDIETAYTGGLLNDFGTTCTNITGTFYCYRIGNSGGNPIIERYNATWGDRKYCDTGCAGACAMTYWRGLAVANTTHLIATKSNGVNALNYRLIPIWNMSGSTSCPATDDLGPAFNSSYTSAASGGYYNVDGNNASAWVYWGLDNGIRNSTSNAWLGNSFWDASLINELRLPDQGNNTTMYSIYHNAVYVYVNGAYVSNDVNISNIWGIGVSDAVADYDFWAESASTTWLYACDGTNLIRVNYSEAVGLGSGSQVYAVSPVENETVTDNPPQLHAVVVSTLNGTLTWFVDDVMQPNASVNITTGVKNVYFTPSGVQDSGVHTWYLIFTDSNGYNWIMTPVAWYNIGLEQFTINNPIRGGAGMVGKLFDVDSQEDAENIYSILVSMFLGIAGVVIITLITKGKHMSGGNLVFLFGLIFIGSILVFLNAGMLNTFYALLLLIMAALGIWAASGGLGGG